MDRRDGGGWKNGGMWVFCNTGNQLWSGSLSDKVTEISGIHINGNGDSKQEAVIGADSGEVAIFSDSGARNNLSTYSTGITRVDVGKLAGQRYVVIADGSQVQAEKVNFSSIPDFLYTPCSLV